MAQTRRGKKIVPVKQHRRKIGRKTVKVKRHRRSTPN